MDILPKQSLTDESLAALVSQGDLGAFDLLLERYQAKILRYGHKFLLGRPDIEDVTQEIFLKAYRYIKSFDPARKFAPWLYRIAHNEFINLGKKRQSERLDFFDFDAFFPHPAAPETAERATDENQIKAMLDECLNQLPTKYREPLVLFYLEGLDYRGIAEVLRIPPSAVGVRLLRAKAKLKAVSLKFKNSL